LVFTTPASCDRIVPASYLLVRGFDSPFRRDPGFLDEREPFHQLGFHAGCGTPPGIEHIGPGIDKSALHVRRWVCRKHAGSALHVRRWRRGMSGLEITKLRITRITVT
jgi:hypothetical protein